MSYKVSIGILAQGSKWSMNFFSGQASARAAVEALQFTFLEKLQACLDQICIVRYISAKNVDGSRDAFTKKMAKGGTQASQTSSFADVTKTAAVFKLYTTEGDSRSLFLRGLTDSAVTRTQLGVDEPSPNFITQYGQFLRQVVTQDLQVQVRKRSNVDGYRYIDVLSVAPAVGTNNRYSVLTTQGVHGLTAGMDFQMSVPSGNLLLQPYKGQFSVPAGGPASTTTLLVPAQYVSTEDGLPTPGVRLRRVFYEYHNITDWAFDKFTSRDTKNIEGGRGARRPVSYRQ